MTRHDRLMALAQRTGLLRADVDEDQRLANAVAFTHLAAHELNAEGFSPVKATESGDKHGIKPGFLVGRETREHIRIIANVDTPQQLLVWEELPRAGKEIEHAPTLDPAQSPALQAVLAGKAARASKSSKGDSNKSSQGTEGSGAGART